MSNKKYYQFWQKQLKDISEALHKSSPPDFKKQLKQEDFEELGKRPSSGYGFRIDFQDGQVTNNLDGSAVARDLRDAILDSAEMRTLLQDRQIIIRLGKAFILKIEGDKGYKPNHEKRAALAWPVLVKVA